MNLHDFENIDGLDYCRRCGSWSGATGEACVGGGWDLAIGKPWRAEPMDPSKPSRAWRVLAPSKSGQGEIAFLTHLSERDAKAIAAAGQS